MRRVLPTQGSQLLWGLVLQSVPEYVRGQKSSDEAPSTGKRASTDERASEKHLRRLSLNFAPKTDGWPRPTGAQAQAQAHHRSPRRPLEDSSDLGGICWGATLWTCATLGALRPSVTPSGQSRLSSRASPALSKNGGAASQLVLSLGRSRLSRG